MVTSAHEGLHRIFQERPEILGPVFGVLGVPFSAKATVDAVTTDVTETRPLERRVDTVLRIGPSDGEDFLLAIEAQSGKVASKARSWAYYVSYLQAQWSARTRPRPSGRSAPSSAARGAGRLYGCIRWSQGRTTCR